MIHSGFPSTEQEPTPLPVSELQQCVEQSCTVNERTPANAPMSEHAEPQSRKLEDPASLEEDNVSQTAENERQGTTASDEFLLVEANASRSESQEAVRSILVRASELSEVP